VLFQGWPARAKVAALKPVPSSTTGYMEINSRPFNVYRHIMCRKLQRIL
jgi:hypothetical protein